MSEYLTFMLYGPLASWGGIAVGEVRQTDSIPTRSALLGLVAAALGVRRDDAKRLTELRDGLSLAVLVVHSGTLLQDYQTAQVPPARLAGQWHLRGEALDRLFRDDLNTILSWREYRCDALYFVALAVRDGALLDLGSIREALRHPTFSPSLGRRSCVLALPMTPIVDQATTVDEAFAKYEASARVTRWMEGRAHLARRLRTRRPETRIIAADNDATLHRIDEYVTRRDVAESYDVDRWYYDDRIEVRQRVSTGEAG